MENKLYLFSGAIDDSLRSDLESLSVDVCISRKEHYEKLSNIMNSKKNREATDFGIVFQHEPWENNYEEHVQEVKYILNEYRKYFRFYGVLVKIIFHTNNLLFNSDMHELTKDCYWVYVSYDTQGKVEKLLDVIYEDSA